VTTETWSGGPWWTFSTRKSQAATLLVMALLAAISVVTQQARDRVFATDRPEEQILYVQSPAIVKRLVLSYDGLAADIYWIRALQHFGRSRKLEETPSASAFELQFPLLSRSTSFPTHLAQSRKYQLLYPLLDMATSLDPHFSIAYRFGAIFLSEEPPGGPGRPDQALALLEKGIKASPQKWQYYQDAGFVNYWARQNYVEAARWFEKGSRISGAPWWLKSLAANTLSVGGDRQASRALYTALTQSSENDFMRRDAARRLRQLDAMDQLDALRTVVARYQASSGGRPATWQALIGAGLLRDLPRDPDGFPFALSPTGEVSLDRASTMRPLPVEPARATSPPA
jgi:tetratricopeptide (TPR) repeat protein